MECEVEIQRRHDSVRRYSEHQCVKTVCARPGLQVTVTEPEQANVWEQWARDMRGGPQKRRMGRYADAREEREEVNKNALRGRRKPGA